MPKQLTPEQSTLIERKRKAALELRSKKVINVVTPDHSICERKENHCDEFRLESGCDCRKAFYEQVCQSKHCSLLIHVGDCIDKFIVGFNAKKNIPICGWCHVWCPDDKQKKQPTIHFDESVSQPQSFVVEDQCPYDNSDVDDFIRNFSFQS